MNKHGGKQSLDPALLQMLPGSSIIKQFGQETGHYSWIFFFWPFFARILWFFLFSFLHFFSPSTLPRKLHRDYAKTPNPSSILPSSMPSYSIRLHGPLLCPLPRPRLKEKRQKEHLEGAEIKWGGKRSRQMGTATEDKAQRRPEHFPINAAGGENKTSHSNTGKMRVKVQ